MVPSIASSVGTLMHNIYSLGGAQTGKRDTRTLPPIIIIIIIINTTLTHYRHTRQGSYGTGNGLHQINTVCTTATTHC